MLQFLAEIITTINSLSALSDNIIIFRTNEQITNTFLSTFIANTCPVSLPEIFRTKNTWIQQQ